MRYDIGLIAGPSWRPRSLGDLNQRTVAMIDAMRTLLPQGFGLVIRVHQVASLGEGLTLVAAERVDGMVIADLAFNWARGQSNLDRQRFGGWLPVMPRANLIAVNRASPLAAERDRLAQALAAMWTDGTIEAIVARYRAPPA
jgi:ABC-type amino acid transport substrate-binding protein